jgi:uncharacterized phage protein (TIGR01671 family)
MREILFRGKRLDNGAWAEGYFVAYKNEAYIFEPKEVEYGIDLGGYLDCCQMAEVAPSTVGQYTGVKDKTGRKIFEGDVVRFDGGMFVVSCVECRMGFCFTGIRGRCCVPGFTMVHWEHLEVIGNIHDNSELINE